jgi:2-oxo-4-hydroxy-4-carboxy-5-ureidoimidazoline decarboxylase
MSAITSRKCTLAELNACSAADFVHRIGGVFEHSPWIAEAAAAKRPFANVDDLLAAMTGIVETSGPERQLALIQAHPDLAGRLAQQGLLTAESSREQDAAGLTRADAVTLERITALNTAYRERFGFPFIICARLNGVEAIVAAMEVRLLQEREVEISSALGEVTKIAKLRLMDLIEV